MTSDLDADPWLTLAELFLSDLNGCPECPGALDIEVLGTFEPSPPPWADAGPAGST